MHPVPPDPGLDTLRLHRSQLRESMDALEQALAAPAPGRLAAWAERVHVALVELSGDLRTHVDLAEGPGGLHQAVVATAPRLSTVVSRLAGEHGRLQSLVDDLLVCVDGHASDAAVDVVRDRGNELLGQLVRHRQRSSDMVFEAYQADIGGET